MLDLDHWILESEDHSIQFRPYFTHAEKWFARLNLGYRQAVEAGADFCVKEMEELEILVHEVVAKMKEE